MPNLKLENIILDNFPRLGDLRLHDFEYSVAQKSFYVHLLVKNYDVEEDMLVDLLKNELKGNVELKITKAYCDEDYVVTRVNRFLERDGGYIKPASGSISFDVNKEEDGKYSICFYGSKSFCGYVNDSLKDSLLKYLYRCFIEDFEIKTSEKEGVEMKNVDYLHDLRGIEVTNREMFVGKPSKEMPGFIIDINGEYDNAVLAGKVSALVKRTKKNPPEEGARNKNPYYFTFTLTDPSGYIPCVIFPSVANTKLIEEQLDKKECICIGKISHSKFNGQLNMLVNNITLCDIVTKEPPRDSRDKEEPLYYSVVAPTPYQDYVQTNLLGEKKKEDLSKLIGKTIVCFDLETTGLKVAKDRIVEIGAIKMIDGKITEKFSTLVNPGVPIPKEVTNINNITDDMVKYAPFIEDVMPDFYKFCYGAILCGHNIKGFDIPLLNNEANRCGYIFKHSFIDTLDLSARYVKGASNNSLNALCSRFGVENEKAHRAYEDCVATCKVLISMLTEYPEIII